MISVLRISRLELYMVRLCANRSAAKLSTVTQRVTPSHAYASSSTDRPAPGSIESTSPRRRRRD